MCEQSKHFKFHRVSMSIFDKIKQQINSRKNKRSGKASHNYADSSMIPEEEQQYYQPDEYYEIVTHKGTPFESIVISFEERKKTSFPSKRGLYVPEILMLSFCQNFPHPSRGYPGYWWFQYGVRDVGGMLKSLESRGFIEINPKTGKYMPAKVGRAEMQENEYVAYTHRNSKLSNFTAWEMNRILADGDKSDWLDIFCKHTGELPPLETTGVIIEKFDPSEPLKPVKPRVPLNQIKNLNNWDKGFDEGYPHYQKGEQFRKAGGLYTALEQFDEARYHGYGAPALYRSYAMVFRKMKAYDEEIAILEEGMTRDTASKASDKFIERINRAKELQDKKSKKQN